MEATLDDHLIDVFRINENRGKLVTWYIVSAIGHRRLHTGIFAFGKFHTKICRILRKLVNIFKCRSPLSPLDDTLTGGKITILPLKVAGCAAAPCRVVLTQD